jgi:nucleotide-binding universal stress UspA family protein
MLGSVAAHVARYAQASVLISRTRRVGGHVVAATDFSETAAWAVDAAVAEARTRQAPLLVMHSLDAPMPDVVIGDPGIAPAVTVPAEIIRAALPAATERLSALVAEIPAPVETLVAEEAPSLAITRTAGRLGADLVVVGHAHRSNIGRWVLGSVADAVARDAPCSVLIVKTPLGASTLH